MTVNIATIQTETFGAVTATWRRGNSGGTVLEVSAAGQPTTVGSIEPAGIRLFEKWTRADGAKSPGIKLDATQVAALHAARSAASRPVEQLGHAQIWD